MKMGEVDGKKIGCTVSLLVSKPVPFSSSHADICFLQKHCVLSGVNPQCVFIWMCLRRVWKCF